MFYKTVKFIKVNIGEDLAGKIPYGNSTGIIYSLSCCPALVVLATAVACYNFFNQLQGYFVFYFSTDNIYQRVFIYIIKKFSDVCTPDKTASVFFKNFLRSGNSAKQSFILPARPNVVNKSFVVNWRQVFVNQAMDHAIADSRHGQLPAFIFHNRKPAVWSVLVIILFKIQIQPP